MDSSPIWVYIAHLVLLDLIVIIILDKCVTTRNQLYGAEHYSRNHQFCNYSIFSQEFMEPLGSLLHSQEFFPVPILSQTNPI
jgi:hypothetical protein